jgi:hypothetical protein
MTPPNTDLRMAWMTRSWRVVMVGPDSRGIAVDDILTFNQPLIRYQHLDQDAVNWSNFSPVPGVTNALAGKVAGQPFQIVYNDTSETLTCTMKSAPLGRIVQIGISAAFLGTAVGAALAATLGLHFTGSLLVALLAAATSAIVTLVKSTSGPVPTWVANDGGSGAQVVRTPMSLVAS